MILAVPSFSALATIYPPQMREFHVAPVQTPRKGRYGSATPVASIT